MQELAGILIKLKGSVAMLSPAWDTQLILCLCALAVILVIYPVCRYLMRQWDFRRERLFGFLEGGAIRFYYQMHRPGSFVMTRTIQQRAAMTTEEFMNAFSNDFARWYGRKFFIGPIALLSIVSFSSAWWAFKVLQIWSTHPPSVGNLRSTVASALAGGYLWVVSDQIDRLRRRDFTVSDVYYHCFRILISIPFGICLSNFSEGKTAAALAFFLGAFPTSTLFKIARRLASQSQQLGSADELGGSDLESLQGVSRRDAERFNDEGVTTIAGLAHADPVDLTIRTNFDFAYVIDCISQSLMWIYFGNALSVLAPLSLRGVREINTVVTWLDKPTAPEHTYAQQTLSDAATALKLTEASLLITFRQICKSDYTRFVVEAGC